ncbi:hypothetical protein AJ85_05440 [Alkalihalobacillus alcalophilus ATCC 27647 = CGMCC 1.3604]|uniref:Surface antigen n=1 Tax=Alkalihalobacillus alcalophilus ATCC 27647 = CGMCC 1.3604 TaxID=1218173 RepID=A0A094XCP1_ALKAL|nr:YncE family protein [Alkalihalobacillus alcalophilus]KGA96570.1 hypothetical protein BALCAV_0215435 [Alkalihalobacillus alcalophilus ATCC 27647 = CGMCC 1.3604]MED1563524.1 YncE family protein [Alkalihalobacillus alcalophilus]THG91357.1 hypothetical protein AJ85_05440 [Alkalihalobacillus alcalophilus ATCC 27647 = CGMCC 1.3604]
MRRCLLSNLTLCLLLIILTACLKETFEKPDTNNPYLILSHVKDSKLSYIDLITEKKIMSVQNPYLLTHFEKVSSNQFLATSPQHDSLLLYNFEDGSIQNFVTLNQGLTDIVFSHTNNIVYLSDVENNSIHVVDYESEEWVDSIQVDDYPAEMVLDEKNKRLYVLHSSSHNIVSIDLTKNEIIERFNVIERPSGIYFDGEFIWVGGHGAFGELNQTIYGYLPNGELVHEIALGLMPIALYSDDNSFLYVLCHGDHALYKVDLQKQVIMDSVEVGQNPNFLTSYTDSIYVSNLDGHTITIVNKQTFQTETLPVHEGPYSMIVEDQS